MSEIIDSIENGKCVFRKKRESPEEELFYNKRYFEMIGFPDAEVSIEIGSMNSAMKGGYYSNPEKVTVPFRQFVFLVQGNKMINKFSFFSKDNAITTTKPEPNDPESKTYLDRLLDYNKQAFDAIKTYIKPSEKVNSDKKNTEETSLVNSSYTKSLFTTEEAKPVEVKPLEEAKPFDVKPVDVKPFDVKPVESKPVDVKPVEAKPVEAKPVEEAKPSEVEYWVVKIPIRKSSDTEPKGKYEKMEQQLTQFLLQKKVNKSLMLTMEYELKEVGDDVIYFYKGKEDNSMIIKELFKSSGLKGSKQSVYSI